MSAGRVVGEGGAAAGGASGAMPGRAAVPRAFRGAAELARLIAAREVSSVEAVTECLERVDEWNALATRLADSALATAAQRDREAPRGPLHGVPVTVKTSLDLAGSPTTSGNPSRAHFMPERTGPEAEGYVAAGAVVVGRGNAPDFSLRLHTDNELHGATLNPIDPTRSPGGSGGGEAVAVATGLSALGLGGDVGGSLRIPAAWNGVMALKATTGRIPSSEGGLGGALMTAFGPFARSVEDLRLGYAALVRTDGRDPWAAPGEPAWGGAAGVRGEPAWGGAAGVRGEPAWGGAAGVRGEPAWGGAAGVRGEPAWGGAAGVRGEPAWGGAAGVRGEPAWGGAAGVRGEPAWAGGEAGRRGGAARVVAVLDPSDADPEVRAAIQRAAGQLEGAGYALTDDEPPGLDGMPDLWGRLFLTEIAASWEELAPVLSKDCKQWLEDAFTLRPPLSTAAELVAAYDERHQLARRWPDTLILAPVTTITAPPVGFDLQGPEQLAGLFKAARYCWAANVLGRPALAAQHVQLIGPRFSELALLDAAEALC